MSFQSALDTVLGHECGYSNHPSDRGGATMFGVTQAVYDKFRAANNSPRQPVKEIQRPEVWAIYRDMYWLPAGCDKLPDRLAMVQFDTAVNHGVSRAVRLLQEVVAVPVDGLFGKITEHAVRDVLEMGEDHLIRDYLSAREDLYDEIVERNPSQAVFLRGWKNRIAKLRNETEVA